MLNRRKSQRSYSLTTAYTGVGSPPPNSFSANPAAIAAASSAGMSRSMSMSSSLSAAAAATALKRHNSLTMESLDTVQQLHDNSNDVRSRSSSITTPNPAKPPHPSVYRSNTTRTKNPDRTESLTTTTVRQFGSFELTTTKSVPLKKPHNRNTVQRSSSLLQPPPSFQSSPRRSGGYAGSHISHESDLEPVAEELDTVPKKVKAPAISRSRSPIKSALKDTSRSGSVVSGGSSHDEPNSLNPHLHQKQKHRVSFSERVNDQATKVTEKKKTVQVPNAAATSAAVNQKNQKASLTSAQASKKNATANAAKAAFVKTASANKNSMNGKSSTAAAAAAASKNLQKPEEGEISESGDSIYSDAFDELDQPNIMDVMGSSKKRAAIVKQNDDDISRSSSPASAAAKGAAANTKTVLPQRKPSLRDSMRKKRNSTSTKSPLQQQQQQQHDQQEQLESPSTPTRKTSTRSKPQFESPVDETRAKLEGKQESKPESKQESQPESKPESKQESQPESTPQDENEGQHTTSGEETTLDSVVMPGLTGQIVEDYDYETTEGTSTDDLEGDNAKTATNNDLETIVERQSSEEPSMTSSSKIVESVPANVVKPKPRRRRPVSQKPQPQPQSQQKELDAKALAAKLPMPQPVEYPDSEDDSDSEWRKERQARRRANGTSGGFALFRQAVVQQDSYTPAAATGGKVAAPSHPGPGPIPEKKPMTAKEMAIEMMKNQKASSLHRTPSTSSFERNHNSSASKGFSIKTMRASEDSMQPSSYFNHPIQEYGGNSSKFKSRFEDSDSDDDFALPPLPQSPLESPRAYLRHASASSQGGSSGGGAAKIKEVFSPNKEAKFLVPKKKSPDNANDQRLSQPPVVQQQTHSHFYQNEPCPTGYTMRGGPADKIAPMKKKKFKGLRKMFGIND